MSDYAVVNPATGRDGQGLSDHHRRRPERCDRAGGQRARHMVADRNRRRARGAGPARRRAARRATQELAEIIVREMGKPIEQALGEVEFCADIYEFYADNAEELMADEPIKLLAGDGSAIVRRSSLGVLLGIMPWNFPYYQVARFAGPNLVIGNTILLKHAPQCPESAAAMEEIFREAGFPDGAYVNIYATNDQIERSSPTRACGACRSPAPSAPAPPSPRSPGAT